MQWIEGNDQIGLKCINVDVGFAITNGPRSIEWPSGRRLVKLIKWFEGFIFEVSNEEN